jgi:hypothetical protein
MLNVKEVLIVGDVGLREVREGILYRPQNDDLRSAHHWGRVRAGPTIPGWPICFAVEL